MVRIALRLLALAGAAVAAVTSWVAAASFRVPFGTLAAVALVVFLVAGWLLLGLVEPRVSRRESAGARGIWLLAGGVVYMLVAHFAVGRPPARALEEPPVPEGVDYWTLPDGARLAYLLRQPSSGASGPPMVFLHGGPGIPALPPQAGGSPWPLDFLLEEGHPVYYYDQRGAGLSSRLDLRWARPYTVARHVEDLEAIRRILGVERLVLVGHGWGSTLATQYLLAHPTRVERIIALSPAPLWFPAFPDLVSASARARIDQVQASALALLERPTPRLVVGRLTATTSRWVAHSLVEDWEADQWWTRATGEGWRLGQPNMSCSTDPARGLPSVVGLGYFSHSYTMADALRLPDPRPRLAALDTPILVVRGLCDYIVWPVAQEYLEVMPGAVHVSIPAGGHLLWLEQEVLLGHVIRPFLLGEPVPLSSYHPARSGAR